MVNRSKQAEDARLRQEGLEGLIAHLVGAGYMRSEPQILQPADVFLDLAGEDIRARIFLTTGPEGEELCLRPEYTIPVCRAYLASADAGQKAAFSYLGPIFRQRSAAPCEFAQAGIESFGRTDIADADAEILALSLQAAHAAGAGDLPVRIGDAGLFNSLLSALQLAPVWVRRIRRGHMRGETIADMIAPGAGTGVDHSGVLAALEGVDKKGARALVEDLLSIAGISSVGGRSAGEIADRFLEQASMKSAAGLRDDARAVLEQFLAIKGEPVAALTELRKLASAAKLDLTDALALFEARLKGISARGIDMGKLTFAASFGRNLDYYTGFVFEAGQAGHPIVGGGRYDGLLRRLGAATDIPAVGAAIWCDRLFGGDQA